MYAGRIFYQKQFQTDVLHINIYVCLKEWKEWFQNLDYILE